MKGLGIIRLRVACLLTVLATLGVAPGALTAQAAPALSADTVCVRLSPDTTVVCLVDTLVRYGSSQPDSARYKGIALRTNLAYAASATPNIGLEVPVGEHFSLGFNAGLKPWPRWLAWDWDKTVEKKWRHVLVAPELRFWPSGIYDKLFVGADLIYTHYNVGAVKFPFGLYPRVRDHRLQGDFYGLGVFAGWSWWLSDHWRLEAEAGVGAGYADAKEYECAYCGAEVGRKQGPVLVPKLGLNLSYNLTRRQKREEILEIISRPLDTLVRPQEVLPPMEFTAVLPYVEEWKGVAGKLEKTHPVLRPMSEYRPYTPDRILRKEEGPLYVFYELDKVRLLRSFSEKDYHRDNGPVLDEIMDVTTQILSDTTSSVKIIQIVGLASIEGNLPHNVWLADERALSLQKYIQDRLSIPDGMFETVGGGEAWSEFRDQVHDLVLAGGGAGLTQEQLEWVIEVIDTEPDVNRRESILKKKDGGALFKKLKANVLHDQRNSGYLRIYYDYVPDERAREINAAIDQLASGDYAGALKALEAKRDDPRSDNAYAVALFYNGREAEALEMLRKAAAAGDESASRNLMQLEEIARQRAAYEQYRSEMEAYTRNSNRK